jgi:hypothetical protein
MDRTVLQLLVERLEPEVRGISRLNFSAWVGSDEEASLVSNLRSGKLHLAEAVLHAKAALSSGDPDRIAFAALVCATFERTGWELQETDRRQRGGKVRGAAQTAKSASRWSEYIEKYEKLVASGTHYLKARQIVVQNIDFTVDDRTIRKWLPRPKKWKAAKLVSSQ